MASMNVRGLRVKELRSELQKRGLEKNGVKATLVARLSKALELENANQPYIANIKDVSAEASNSSEVNTLNKTGNGNESTGCHILLKQILNAITGFDERLKSLENKFSDQISIITEHIDAQNVNYRHVEEERRNLQKISELLSNNNVENSNGASSKPESNTPQPSKERYHCCEHSHVKSLRCTWNRLKTTFTYVCLVHG